MIAAMAASRSTYFGTKQPSREARDGAEQHVPNT